jgi:hypothetical protein
LLEFLAVGRGCPKLAHAPDAGVVLPPLCSPDQERQPVPVSGDAERQMQDARREEHRAADGRGD